MASQLSPIIGLLFALPVIAFWVWMFADMVKNDDLPRETKDYWVLAFIFLSIVTAAFYYVNIYRERR